MTNILIIGNGGHARSCIDVIEAEQKYRILGIISNEQTGNNLYIIVCQYVYLL